MIFLLWGGLMFIMVLTKTESKILFLSFSFFLFLSFSFFSQELDSFSNFFFMMSWTMNFLVLWLFFICLPTFQIFLFKKKKNLKHLMTLLMGILFITFCTQEYFTFYILFEMSVFPIFLLIIWGSGSQSRLEAGLFLIFFTISSALMLLFLLFFLQTLGEGNSKCFLNNTHLCEHLELSQFSKNYASYIFFFFICLAFLVKFPFFFLHIWLPKAHVEAPMMGSMILAGVLLKLGGFGFFTLKKIFVVEHVFFNFGFMSCCLHGSVIVGLICFYQNDSKVLIAFSSVNHMTILVFSFLCGSTFSIFGSLLILLGHGLISSLLFFLISLPYSKSSSRLFLSMGPSVMSNGLPLLWLLGVLINLGFPPFINFFGEILIFTHLLSMPFFFLMFLFNFIVGALFSFSLLSYVFQKKKNYFLYSDSMSSESGQFLNLLLGWSHIIPIFFFMNFFVFF